MLDYERIKKALKLNGFDHIKLEFEVNISDNSNTCPHCNEGRVECGDCEGSGEVEIVNTSGAMLDTVGCPSCRGRGEVTCSFCDGHYEGDGELETFQERFISRYPRGFRPTYIETYDDGSVNTEVTITYSVDKLHLSEKLINAFVDTCNTFDSWNTNKAGFHITLLSGSSYPTTLQLPHKKINNFVESMNKIVDAMFFLSASSDSTRSDEYRLPRVSQFDKYSAIYTHDNTCLEYRIFDTCYDKPEAFLGYLNTIVRTLKFYSEKHYLMENWKPSDLDIRIRDERLRLTDIAKSSNWKSMLIDKLIYLYSDRDKLRKIREYVKNGKVSENNALKLLIFKK